jgi:hypothetical protein
MIVFELTCSTSHRFEGWFSSGEDFDRQRDRGLIVCPVCSNASISKVPTAKIKRAEPQQLPVPVAAPESTSLRNPADRAPAPPSAPSAQERAQMLAFIDHVLSHTENVGPKFAEEARKIFHQETPERAIRGTASREETEELWEEGIPVMPIPIPPQSDWH